MDNQKLRDAKKNAEALYWSMSTAQKGIGAALEYMASALQSQPQAPEAGLDELVELLNEKIAFHFGKSSLPACRNIAEALAAAGYLAKQDGWVSVKDRLPEIGTEVQVYVPSKLDFSRNPVTALTRLICYEEALDYYWNNNYGGSNIHVQDAVTHWRPLSSPPTALGQKEADNG